MCVEVENLEQLSLEELVDREAGFVHDISMTGADLRAVQAAIKKAIGEV